MSRDQSKRYYGAGPRHIGLLLGSHPPAPDLVERTCGGWLAITPADCGLRFAVEGDTQTEACNEFVTSWAQWMVLLEKAEARYEDEAR